MTSSPRRILALALLAAATAAPLAALAAGATKPAAAEKEDGYVAAPQKPNGSGVRIRYQVQGTPAAGQPTRVDIVLARVRDAGGATLQLSADPSLQLDASGVPATVPAGERTRVSVTVVPREEGLAYIHVFTTQRGATSSVSIPVQTGAAGASGSTKGMAGKLKETPDGDRILSMPVK